MRTTLIGAMALAVALTACGRDNGAAESTAETITKAVIANDSAAVQGVMDDALRAKVTRASVGALSDKMHKLGDFKDLTLLSSDLTRNEYTYRADFEHGAMKVIIRLDKDGKAAAYRAVPNT
jgi:hypothetical protein